MILVLVLSVNLVLFGCMSEGSANTFHPCWQSKTPPSGTESDKLVRGYLEHHTTTDDTWMFFCYDKTGGTFGMDYYDDNRVVHPATAQVNFKWDTKGNQLCISKEIIPFGLMYSSEICKSYSFPNDNIPIWNEKVITWGDENFKIVGQTW